MKKKLKNLLGKKENKTLLENFFSLSAIQVVSMVLPLITFPYIIRVIGLNNYGTIALALSLVTYFMSLVDFSFMITATRDVSLHRHSHRALSLIYSRVMTIKFFFLMVSFAIIAAIILIYPPFYEERAVFFICASTLLGHVLFPEWFFHGIEKMKFITIIKISAQILFTIGIFLFIHKSSDYWIYPLLTSAGGLISGIIGQVVLLNKYRLKFKVLSWQRVMITIMGNSPIFYNQFLPTLYNNSSTFLLGFFVSPYLIGVYAAIRKIIDIAVVILGIFSRVFFPLINKKRSAFDFYKKVSITVTFVGTGLIVLLHPLIFLYLNVEYKYDLLILIFLSLSIIGLSMYDIYGLNYLIVRRQDKVVLRNTLFISVIGFLTAFPLLYFLGIIGASLNIFLSRSIMGLGVFLKYKSIKNDKVL
ncbi:oligosaccharide flippase family protein [Pontibacter pamirensis]|uniref:oligosaccharide flippase family protein n=1 Tax=Pontibacter pamirensis TaxID=2562824 RepID=UPI00192E7584|nr:oligosaccharide flippase family protein [Pontibacter pamirensis]